MSVFFKRWLGRWKLVISDTVTGVGLFWLGIEITSYSTDGQIDEFAKSIVFFSFWVSLVIIVSIFKNKPKTSFSYKLRDKDNKIEIKIGDAFKNEGALIIPINDHFDVSLGGNVKKAKSLQSRLIKDYYSGKEDHFLSDIKNKVNIKMKHEIGTTIEIEQNEKTFLLLVNSRKKNNNRVESTTEDFLLSLTKVWEFIALESGRKSVVTIPLLSTNHGRITNLNRTKTIKEIIQSYVESSKQLNIADKLIISIFLDDLTKGSIDLDEIDEYLKFSCKYYRKVNLSTKMEGKEITASEIISIEN